MLYFIILYINGKYLYKGCSMIKLLLFSLFLMGSSINADEKSNLQAEIDKKEEELKTLKEEIALYNKSVPILRTAQGIIANNNSIITTTTNKLERLTGFSIKTDGTPSYNNLLTANPALTDKNTKLQQEIDDLTTEKSLDETSIVTARASLGDLRTRTETPSILANIKFYQDKIAEYQGKISKYDSDILKKRSEITQNTNTLELNNKKIKTFEDQLDAAKKAIEENQAIVDSTNEKINNGTYKINFNNITIMNNNVGELERSISNLKNKLSNLKAETPATPAA